MAPATAPSTITDLEPGQHICCLYETQQERATSLLSFIHEGLEHGERILLIIDDQADDPILNDLGAGNSELEPLLKSEQLILRTVHDTHTQAGVFVPDRMIAMLEAETERAMAEGYHGLRVTGGTAWMQQHVEPARLIEHENKLNAFLSGSRCLALCQYDQRRSDAEMLLSVLATHPTVVVGTERYDNFCCLPTMDFVRGDPSVAVLRYWLEILAARKRTEEALRVSERKFRAQYKSMPIPTFTWQQSGNDFVLVDYNAAGGFATKGRVADLVGRKAGDLYRDRPDILDDFQRCFEDRTTASREMTYIFRTTGETGLFAITYVFVPPDLVMVHAEDITERHQTEEALRRQAQAIDQVHDSVVSTDLDAYVTSWNKGAERLFGYTAGEALGRHISFVYPPDQHAFLQREVIDPLQEKGNRELDVRMRRKSGEDFYAHLSLSLLRDGQGTITGMIGYAADITERVRAETALEARARQQAAVAALGQRALAGVDLSVLMDEAVSIVAETLDVDYCKVLELLPDGEALLLRAGAGWNEGYVGHAQVNAKTRSQAGYTLLAREPVIVADLRTETRFSGPPLLADHGVVSGVSVVIRGQERPFGILGAHTTQRRTFTEDSVHFLQTVANVLAEAIERKRAEQSIRQQADLLEQTHDAILVWELGGKILSWNKGAEDLYGWSREEAVGRVTHELLKSEHPISIQELETALKQQGHWEGEVTHIARDGRRLVVESRHVLARYASGSQFVLETNHDITERKQARERLAYQAHLLANVHDAILAVDDQFKITAWNRAAERMYGWPAEKVLGRKVQEVIPSEFTDDEPAKVLQVLHEVGHHRTEMAQYTRAGEPIFVEGTIIALRDDSGRVTGYVSVNRDITQRNQAQAALRESEKRFRQLAENIREVFWMVSADGEQIIYISPAYEQVWGRSVASAYAEPTTWHEAIHPDDREAVLAAYTPEKLVRGQFDVEYRVLRPDGSMRWIRDRGFPIRSEQREVYRVAGIAEDITERRQAEAALQQYAERLENLREIDTAVLAAQSLEEIAQAAVRRIRQLVPCQRVSFALFDLEAQQAVVLAADTQGGPTDLASGRSFALDAFADIALLGEGQHRVVEDIEQMARQSPTDAQLLAEGIRSYANIPLVAGDELIGSLNLGANIPHALASEQLDIAREVAGPLAIAVQQARLLANLRRAHERLESLSSRLVEAQETERRRIAHELHDEIGQTLTSVKINLLALQRRKDGAYFDSRLEASIGVVDRALEQVRNLALDLRPSLLDDLGLISTLRWYLDRQARWGGLAAQFTAEPSEMNLPAELETVCFRVVQEALTNVMRHAQAQQMCVELYQHATQLELIIRDDGVGFEVPAALDRAIHGGSLGLLGMQERVRLAGGEIDIESVPGRGTEVRARFPLRET